jgi:NAD(P)-dependent dehydrogenase (short-subunit alcohol dehydrogenase family)
MTYERTTRKSLFSHRRQPRHWPCDRASDGRGGSGRGIHVSKLKGASRGARAIAERKLCEMQSVSGECGVGGRNAERGQTGPQRFWPITILVNNAGITRDKSFLKMTKEMWEDVIGVDLNGVFYTTQLVVQDMVENGGGRIINISSIIGQTGNFGQANYAAAKGAVISFTESLARELARKGITVNAVAPGFVETDMVKDMPEAALTQVKAMTPMGRLGKPEEIADAVVFLASPRSSYVTGQVLAVNGGMYM